MSMSLYRVCCAASCSGSASAANKVIAVMRVNVLDFMLHLVESWESRGRPAQSNHCEGIGRRVRLCDISLCLKRLVSTQNYCGWRRGMPCQTVLLRTMCPCAPTMAASTPTSGFVRRSKKEEYRKYLAF